MSHYSVFFAVRQSDHGNKAIRAAACRIFFNRQQRDHYPAIQLSNNIARDIKQQWVNGAFTGITVYGELHG
ncbi:hypothetical protein BN1221_00502 [Brenneria goodwinii]|uniref:Uncharacterized protein n=1 Tax=Brenneria goodwinii TaxID=1109412 RepID=A0A0G4JQA7_9GAMM|nr:hypothetical protein BN1221_00502 [Brenneria goodwinii]